MEEGPGTQNNYLFLGGVEKIVLFRLLQPDNKNSSKCDRGENYTEKRRRRGTFCAKYLHHIFWALPNSRNKAVQNRRPITLFPSFSLGRIRETRNSGYKNKPPNLGEHCIEVRFEEQGKPNWHDEQWCAKILKICFTYILLFSYFTLTLISRSLGFGRSYHKIAPLCQTTANMALGILFIFVFLEGN